ncbi:MAG: hypothetical protein B6245_01400 [Desulfobacteraceae bacterium 4572_88]|nr:MAG: hypothetical protein B6245_01400 [Desulfobacteraceae bacterium 4572_88]
MVSKAFFACLLHDSGFQDETDISDPLSYSRNDSISSESVQASELANLSLPVSPTRRRFFCMVISSCVFFKNKIKIVLICEESFKTDRK